MTNKLFLILGLVLAIPIFCFSQKKIEIDLNLIPIELRNDNHVITIDKTQNVDIIDQMSLVNKVSETFFVLDEIGLKSLDLLVYYDKLSKVKSIECKLYDANGDLIKTFKEKEFVDISIADGFSIFTDDRIKYLKLNHYKFPFFIKFDVVTENSNTISIPSFYPINNIDEYVINTNYTLSFPEGFEIKKLESNLEKFNIKTTTAKGIISYAGNNLQAPEREELNFRYLDLLPMSKFSNNKFALSGVKGEANSWDDFGRWYYANFLRDSESLSQQTVLKMKEITKNAKTDIEKAKIIFDYVQNNTRYISIQVGLGGWKPFSAKEVDKLGYGDCKALTNFTRVLLKSVGVESFYTIIHADNNLLDINEKLISLQGNHVILTIPSAQGSIFLESTSQKIPFGFLGNSTDNRKALVIKPDGAYIIQTHSNDNNLLKANFIVELKDMKTVKTSVDFENYGLYYNKMFSLNVNDKKEVESYLKNLFSNLKNINILKYLSDNDKNQFVFNESIELESAFIGSKMGNDFILNLNPYINLVSIPKKYVNRKSGFNVNRNNSYEIVTSYHIPEGFIITNLPVSKSLESKYGVYKSDINLDGQILTVSEKMNLKSGDYLKEEYDSYYQFLKEISNNNNSKFLISKK